MAAKTWDTSRTGGGTYEFTQDAQGNYTLGSVGFQKLNKLNLPGLQKETTATTSQTKDTATASAQTAKAFGDVQPFYYDQKGGGGGADQSLPMTKDRSLTENLRTDTKTDARPEMLGDYGFKKSDITTKTQSDLPPWAQGADKRGYENIGKKVESTNQVGRANVDQVLADRQDKSTAWGSTGQWGPKPSAGMPTERIPDRITSPLRPSIEAPKALNVFTTKAKDVATTKLKQVNSTLKTLSNVAGLVFNPIATGAKMVMGALPKTTDQQRFDRGRFNVVGNTNRIAGNPATDLYAGFNRTSAYGNLEAAGSRRLATREKTSARLTGKRKEKFDAVTAKMEKEQHDYRSAKNKSAVKSAVKKGASIMNPAEMHAATGGGGGCFLKGTPITMANGSTKPVDQVDLGDKVAEGGKVFAAGRFLINDLYDYKGIKVSGSHMVNENDTWVRIRGSKKGKPLGDDEHTVYVFGAENRRILIKDILFTDYFEVKEQDKLAVVGDKYFEEWEDHDKIFVKLEENHNVAVLNRH